MDENTTYDGGAILHELRRRAGLSQARLAKLSGVGVRTIRAIEKGQHRAPHEATLEALAGGIGLNEADTVRLTRAWDDARTVVTFEELIANGSEISDALAQLNVQNRNNCRLLADQRHYRVAATRRVRSLESVSVIETLRDGVRNHLVFRAGDQSMDARLMHMEEVEGCRVEGRHVVPEHNAVMFELGLGAPMAAGETRILRYRLDLGGTPPDAAEQAAIWHGLGDSDGMVDSHSRSCPLNMTQVTFEDCTPARVYRVIGVEEPQEAGDLEIDEWNSVHVVAQNLEPGVYGIGWDWD